MCCTPVVSDGETMVGLLVVGVVLYKPHPQGSGGMRYSLISRDWIADCVEIMHEAYAAVSYHGNQ